MEYMEWLTKLLGWLLLVTLVMLFLGGNIGHGVGVSMLLRGMWWWLAGSTASSRASR